jgi:hypothetical protein
VFVLLGPDRPTEHTTERTEPTEDRTAELIATLREQLQAERQAHAEARRLLAAALERIPAIEAPAETPEASETVEEAPERARSPTRLQGTLRRTCSGVPGGVGCLADEAERLRRDDVSEASGNESLPSGMERKVLIRPLPTELLSETMLQLGGGNDIDLGDYIEENYLSDWRVVSHTIHFRPEGSHILTVLVERPR